MTCQFLYEIYHLHSLLPSAQSKRKSRVKQED